PLARARGLGSAGEGAARWCAERLTAVALVPLMLWFVASLIMLTGAGHGAVVAWLGDPVTAVIMVLLIGAVFHHAQLGLQVVIEDYVHTEWRKIAAIVFVKFAAIALAAACIFAILKIALRS
ncbi:MAG: succinate dehydrogenase, hydrophobic membrane anchor protein, partial [Alphaproteobacteria bacterium]